MNLRQLKTREKELDRELKNIRYRRKCLNTYIENTSITWIRNHKDCKVPSLLIDIIDKWLKEMADEETSREEMMKYIQKKLDENNF